MTHGCFLKWARALTMLVLGGSVFPHANPVAAQQARPIESRDESRMTKARSSGLALDAGRSTLDSEAAVARAVALADDLAVAFHHAAERVRPAVVAIEMQTASRRTRHWAKLESPARHMEDEPPHSCPECERRNGEPDDGIASGIVIDAEGIIVTNNHVVAGADQVVVRLPDGRTFHPVDVRRDPPSDLAILRISGAGRLTAATLGDSNGVRVGSWVVGIGNPFGLEGSVSAGIVSATNRRVPDVSGVLLQTDAATNPGSSGGPLVNLRGEVVGVNQGSMGIGSGFQGIGFAVPSNVARRVIRDLIEYGEVRRAYLGCEVERLRPAVATKLGLDGAARCQGALVTDVGPDTPAEQAGLKPGDVVTHFANRPIAEPAQLQEALVNTTPPATVPLQIVRDGVPKSLTVELRPMPAPLSPPPSVAAVLAKLPEYKDNALGLTLTEVPPEAAEQLGFPFGTAGVLITQVSPHGIAAREGLCAGMFIRQAARQPIRTIADFQRAVQGQSLENGVLLLAGALDRQRFVVLENRSAATQARRPGFPFMRQANHAADPLGPLKTP